MCWGFLLELESGIILRACARSRTGTIFRGSKINSATEQCNWLAAPPAEMLAFAP